MGTEGERLHILAREGVRRVQVRVGFAVRNRLLSMIEPGSNGSERLLTLRLNTTAGPVILVRVYASTMSATSDTKNEFYENLATIISSNLFSWTTSMPG